MKKVPPELHAYATEIVASKFPLELREKVAKIYLNGWRDGVSDTRDSMNKTEVFVDDADELALAQAACARIRSIG